MIHIPRILIYSRLSIGVLILGLSLVHVANYSIAAVALFAVGLLTDILDGIIARRLNVSTQSLRRLDSTIDQVFFIMVAVATYVQCPPFFYDHRIELFVLLGAEAITYLICFLKFRKEVATHALSSKLWTLLLFATLVQLMMTCSSDMLFRVCFYVGVATRIEIMGILLILRTWTNDVPSLYHAVLLRQGKTINRHKLFNG